MKTKVLKNFNRRDFRDGTNHTGLNPKEEKLIRHIGFSGHYNAGVMMEMIQRDKDNLLEGLLVAGKSPVNSYEIWRNNIKAGVVRHTPQTTKKPFKFVDTVESMDKVKYMIFTVDKESNKVETINN